MTIHTVTTSPIFSKRIGEGHFWGLGSLAWNNQSPSSMPRLSFSLARCLVDFSARHSHHLVSETMLSIHAIQVMRRFQREVMTAFFFFFQFQYQKRLFLPAFHDTSTCIVKYCMEAPLYLHFLKLGFLHGQNFIQLAFKNSPQLWY